jgi:hypothetical protein
MKLKQEVFNMGNFVGGIGDRNDDFIWVIIVIIILILIFCCCFD